jgi:phage baseplate assembly protein W
MPAREQQPYPLPEKLTKIIGQGISFPFSFSSRGRSRQLDVRSGSAKINQSIHLILGTRIGERMMVPAFGSRLPDLIFEPEDDILYDLLYLHTVEALRRWEPRIRIVGVTIIASNSMKTHFGSPDAWNSLAPEAARENARIVNAPLGHTVGIQIDYEILTSHQISSYVYPFRLGAMPLVDSL